MRESVDDAMQQTPAASAQAAASARIERQKLILEYVKVVGALLVALIALLEYSNHNKQERAAEMLDAIKLTQQSTTIALREDLAKLVEFTRTKYNVGSKNIDSDLRQRDKVLVEYIRGTVFAVSGGEFFRFKNVFSSLESMYQYGSMSACRWEVIARAFHSDAGQMIYYFELVLPWYAENQGGLSTQFLYDLEWQSRKDKKFSPCTGDGSLLTKFS